MFSSSHLFRTNKARQLEEKNILLFIQKSEELLNIKKIFDLKDEKVFRRLENSWIILNAIVKLSKLTNSKLRKTEVNHFYNKFESFNFHYLGPRSQQKLELEVR